MDEDPVHQWLADCRRPFPGAVELAAMMGKEARGRRLFGWQRDTILRLANLCASLDALIKAHVDLIGRMSESLAQWQSATKSAAQTAELALGRLQEQEQLVLAALEWARARESGDRVEAMGATLDAAHAYLEVVRKRS